MAMHAEPMIWRRLIARLIDALWIAPCGLLLARAVGVLSGLHWSWQLAVGALMASGLQLAIEPLFVTFLRATPGKALARLEVVSSLSGGRLSYPAALGRTLKVVALGSGFWLLPLTVITSLAVAWRWRAGLGLAWDHDRAGGRVQPTARAHWGRAAAMMAAALVPGWLVPMAGFVVALLFMTSRSLDASQDISRAMTGRWQWLHSLSGQTLMLDARWRVLQDHISLRDGRWQAVLAFGVGGDNRIELETRFARRPGAGSACAGAQFDLEEEGFVFIGETELADGSCTATGGKPSSKATMLVRVDGARGPAGDRTLTRVYMHADEEVSGAMEAVAKQLWAQRGEVDMSDGRLRSYYWRNDLSGARVRLPGDWEFSQRTVNSNGTTAFLFARVGQTPTSAPAMAGVFMFPVGTPGTVAHAAVEQTMVRTRAVGELQRWQLEGGEALTLAPTAAGSIHAWTQEDILVTRAAFWATPHGMPSVDDPRKHPVLGELLRTMP